MGHIIPAGTGFNYHRNVNVRPLVDELPPEDITMDLEQPAAG
jgi:hypothetical protein